MQEQIQYVNVEDIIPNRFQPRKNFDQDSLQELAESIKQHGIIQPLVLRKLGTKFEIIAGERRYKAANMIGLKQVPSIIMELDDATSAEIALAENIQRKDLTAVEKAKSYKQILSLGQMTQEELAKKMGKSQPAVSNTLRLLELSDEVQDALLKNKISERHARSLLALKNHDAQIQMLNKIIEKRMTVRETDLEIKKELENNKGNETQDEEIEEIIDFNSDNNSKDENNNNVAGIIEDKEEIETIKENDDMIIEQDNSNKNNIPEFDQININQNNKLINSYENLDDEAANMNMGSNEEQNEFNNFINIPQDEPILNSSPQKEEMEVSQTPMLSEENNAFNQSIPQNAEQNGVYQPQPMYEQNNMYQNAQPIIPNQNGMFNFNQPITPNQNNIYPNMQPVIPDQNSMFGFNQPMMPNQNNMYPNMQPAIPDQNGMFGFNQPMMPNQNNMYPNMQPVIPDQNSMFGFNQPMMPNQNNIYPNMQPAISDQNAIYPNSGNIFPGNDMNQNQLYPDTNNSYQSQEDQITDPEPEQGPQAIIMQHDITGAVAVLRNTVMNLQNNGYNIQITEDDNISEYKITITLDK